LELAKKAIDLSIAAPEDAIMQARRAKDYITDILRGKGQTTTDAIRDVSDQIARSYLYLINALGNVAAHEQADRLTKEDALVAATALVRVLKWWQDTG
jgi:CHASE3 domain sensor protein